MQYGPRLAATTVYLQSAQFRPEQRLAELCREWCGVPLCIATLARLRRRGASQRQAWVEQLREQLVRGPGVKHLDETGFRMAGRGQWLPVLSTVQLTYYRINRRRLAGLVGYLGPRSLGSCCTAPGMLHEICHAHYLRELKALARLAGEAWAKPMQRGLSWARARQLELPASWLERLDGRYDEMPRQALAYHEGLPPLPPASAPQRGRKKRRPGHNLACGCSSDGTPRCAFCARQEVPFANNQAEQDWRRMQLWMQISGGFRSVHGVWNCQ